MVAFPDFRVLCTRAFTPTAGIAQTGRTSSREKELGSLFPNIVLRMNCCYTGMNIHVLREHCPMAKKEFKKTDGTPVPGVTLRLTLVGHQDRIGRMAWSPDGYYLASPSDDGTINIWDISAKSHQTLGEPNDAKSDKWISEIYCVSWSPDGKIIASGSSDHDVKLWNVKTGQQTKLLKGHYELVTSLSWSPDGSMLASGSDDRSVIIWDAKTGKVLQTFDEHNNWVTSVVWSPDGKRLASGSGDAVIRIWDIESNKLSRQLRGHTERVTNLVWTVQYIVKRSFPHPLMPQSRYGIPKQVYKKKVWKVMRQLYAPYLFLKMVIFLHPILGIEPYAFGVMTT
jgi:WD40 repeat protein